MDQQDVAGGSANQPNASEPPQASATQEEILNAVAPDSSSDEAGENSSVLMNEQPNPFLPPQPTTSPLLSSLYGRQSLPMADE